MVGESTEEAEVPVRQLTIRKGRVVSDYFKPGGLADRARLWTDRRSGLLGEMNDAHLGNRHQRLPSNVSVPSPMSKYNSMRQQKPLPEQGVYPGREPKSRKSREASRYATRDKRSNAPIALQLPPARVYKPSAALEGNPRRSRVRQSSSTSNPQVRRLAKSVERAYEGPSPQARNKKNASTPSIVITRETLIAPKFRTESTPTARASMERYDSRSRRSSTPRLPRNSTQSGQSSNPTRRHPTTMHVEGGSSRRNHGHTRVGIASVSVSSSFVITSPPPTPPPTRPLPDLPPLPDRLIGPSVLGQHGSLRRSQNTVRRKRSGRPTHRAVKPIGVDSTSNPRSPSLGSEMYPTKAETQHPPNHSRKSSKSMATIASSDISENYSVVSALPMPILPASTVHLDHVARRDKALPMLPVAEDPDLEKDEMERAELGKGTNTVIDPQRDELPSSL